jgi:uncharacterized membrane protein YqiK
MAEDRGSSGPSVALIAVIAVLVIAGLAIWFTTRNTTTTETRDSTTILDQRDGGSTTTGSAPSGDTDVNIKADVPDSVTIDAH